MTRTTGTYAISTTLGESVRAFVPYALPASVFADCHSCRQDVGEHGHRGGNDGPEKESQLQLQSLR
jgi:hypothetical protein